MNLPLLLCAAYLGLFDLVNARPQGPGPSVECVIQEDGRTYIGECTTLKGAPDKVLLYSESCDANTGERCLVNAMPCSGQYNFFCGTENIGCFAAPNLQLHPEYTGEKLGQGQGICPQDLTCCHGCSGKACDPILFRKHSSNQPSIEPEIAGLPSSSPEEFRLYDTTFNLADSTIPIGPNADTLSPTNIDTNNGKPGTDAADLLRIPNSQEQNTDLNPGKTTSNLFKQAPVDLNQIITLPAEYPPDGIPQLPLAPEDYPVYKVPVDR